MSLTLGVDFINFLFHQEIANRFFGPAFFLQVLFWLLLYVPRLLLGCCKIFFLVLA